MKNTKLEENCNTLKEQIKARTNFNKARIFMLVGYGYHFGIQSYKFLELFLKEIL